MNSVKLIFDELQATNSSNEKQEVIKANLGNDLFVEVMRFLLDDFCITCISSKKMKKKLDGKFDVVRLNNVSEVIEYLKLHNTGSDVDVATIQHFISYQSDELTNVYEDIFTKSLKLGVTAKTFNKCASKDYQIPTFSCMLAKKYEDCKHKIKGDFVISKKLDGNRIIICKENGTVSSFTRTGKPYVGLNEIENEIKDLSIDDIVFDGELLADSKGTSNEVFTETIKKSRTKDKNKTGLIFHIFDCIPLEEFKQGKSKESAIQRKNTLYKLFNCNKFKHCQLVGSLYIGNSKSMIDRWLKCALSQGWEGVMVNLDKPYECKRTDSLLKVKVMQTCDLKVIGFELGAGKFSDTLGALVLDYKGYKLKCGSGLTNEMRDDIWNNRNEYLGRVVEVQYFEEIETCGELSLRFPIFKCVRELGKEVSYN